MQAHHKQARTSDSDRPVGFFCPHALGVLEFPRVLDVVAGYAHSSLGAARVRSLTPSLDLDAVLASVGKTGRCVIAHEAPNTGSWAAELSALIAERGLLRLLAPVARVGGWDIRMPLFRLEQYYIPDADRVVMAACKTLSF